MSHPPPPILIPMPRGVVLSGITSWALRLSRGLSERGHAVALVIHPSIGDRIDEEFAPGIAVHRIDSAPPMDSCAGNYDAFLPAYRLALDQLAAASDAPAIALPNLDAECHGLFARLTRERPGSLRIASWTHSDIAHDYRIAQHYEPMLGVLVGVSGRIARELASRLPGRAADIRHIPYGVEINPRPSRTRRDASDPLRLIYAGRIDHFQKRVMALPSMSGALERHGIAHTLTIVGEGPASNDLDHAIASLPSVRRVRAASAEVRRLMRGHDVFVLPSRFEGLSIAMLEAMEAGCVPVVTRIASGAEDAITPGVNGELVDPIEDDAALGESMAEGVRRACRSGLEMLGNHAMRTVRDAFSLDAHLSSAQSIFARLASSPARDWPSDRSPAAADESGVGFSVPPDAPDAAARAISRLAGRRVALWGGGRHTIAVLGAIGEVFDNIIAVIDDDPTRRGGTVHHRPVVSADRAAGMGVTDVLISSALHERDMWEQRESMSRLGLRVHRMYGADSVLAAV